MTDSYKYYDLDQHEEYYDKNNHLNNGKRYENNLQYTQLNNNNQQNNNNQN